MATFCTNCEFVKTKRRHFYFYLLNPCNFTVNSFLSGFVGALFFTLCTSPRCPSWPVLLLHTVFFNLLGERLRPVNSTVNCSWTYCQLTSLTSVYLFSTYRKMSTSTRSRDTDNTRTCFESESIRLVHLLFSCDFCTTDFIGCI